MYFWSYDWSCIIYSIVVLFYVFASTYSEMLDYKVPEKSEDRIYFPICEPIRYKILQLYSYKIHWSVTCKLNFTEN